MAQDEIERTAEFDADEISYRTAIDRVVDAVREQYDVKRITGAGASYNEYNTQWWVKVEAELESVDA